MSYKEHKYSVVSPLVKAFLETHPEAEWGFAHVVLSDNNYDTQCIENCLTAASNTGISDDDPVVVFLRQLLEIPEEIRDKEPDIIPELLTREEMYLLDWLWGLKPKESKDIGFTVNTQSNKEDIRSFNQLMHDGYIEDFRITILAEVVDEAGKYVSSIGEALCKWSVAGHEFMTERHS